MITIKRTSPLKELVCFLMKLENAAINCSKDGLKFLIALECLLITIESGERRSNICVCGKEGLKNFAMLRCNLNHRQSVALADRWTLLLVVQTMFTYLDQELDGSLKEISILLVGNTQEPQTQAYGRKGVPLHRVSTAIANFPMPSKKGRSRRRFCAHCRPLWSRSISPIAWKTSSSLVDANFCASSSEMDRLSFSKASAMVLLGLAISSKEVKGRSEKSHERSCRPPCGGHTARRPGGDSNVSHWAVHRG